MIGRTLSHYQITEKLGEGGMGVVYKARDTHLDRFVAIKVLPPEKVADPERKRRFVQEAKAASALNHPNIIHIYDVDQAEGIDFIAMEYVAGKSLDHRIGHRGLRLNDALKYAVQIADALAKAHSAGIVHRDLKPTNIMVSEDGVVKVLDFGLAKLTEQVQGDEAASTATIDDEGRPITEQGVIVGTVAYMSPEQAEGKKVDARSDLFSFGSVLYEMVTGQKAFQGTSKISTLSAILHQEPKPVSGISPTIPAELERLINRCLRKDPSKRFQHIDDVKVALDELKEDSDSGKLGGGAPVRRGGRSYLWPSAILAAGVLLAVTAWFWLGRSRPAEESSPLTAVPLTTYPGIETSPSFSPDGSQVAFSWDGERQDNYDIYVKMVDGGPPLRLTTNPAPESAAAWSPDGRWIAFYRGGQESGLYLVSPLGGPERKLTMAGPSQICWTPDAKAMVYSHRNSEKEPYSLWVISVASGERRRLTFPPGNLLGDRSCAVSPDGRDVAFGRWVMLRVGAGIWLVSLAGGEPRRLTTPNLEAHNVSWLPSGGEIVFGTGELAVAPMPYGDPALWRLRIPAAGETEPQRLTGVDRVSGWPSISRPGPGRLVRLAYVRYEWDSNFWRLNSPAGGAPGSQAMICSSTRVEQYPAISPDGRKIVFMSDRSGSREIWSCDSDGSNPVQLTNAEGEVGTPSWSPDGRRIAFDILTGGNRDIYVMNSDGTALRRMTADPANDGRATWSRDGRWIYFHSARSGTHEIWKMPAEGGPAIELTRGGGSEPRESRDGALVYYVKSISEGGLWAVPVEGGEEREILAGIRRGEWTVGPGGVYLIDPPFPGAKSPIHVLDPETGRRTGLGVTVGPGPLDVPRLSISPDGRWLVWTQLDRLSADLMLVENFR